MVNRRGGNTVAGYGGTNQVPAVPGQIRSSSGVA